MSRFRRTSLLVLLVTPVGSWAGVGAYLEPDYSNIYQRSTDQFGHTTTTTTNELDQHYRLTLDENLYPYVRLNAAGMFDDARAWSITNGAKNNTDSMTTNGTAHLYLGPPVLNGDLGFERRDDWETGTLSPGRQHLVDNRYTVRAGWAPADLPRFDLRLSRTDEYDVPRARSDLTNDDALFAATYNGVRQLNLTYSLLWQRSEDHLSGTETTALTNDARLLYNDTLNDGRTIVLGSYAFNNRISDTSVAGAGGTVAVPQIPSAGLSLIEAFPAIPERDTLAQNPALIDGNTTASANVNIGYSVSLAGDTNFRDLGVQFADPTTAVNTLYVWVDKQLPPEIVSTYTWAAYGSDDNVNWTQVGISGPVLFGTFQNRFEITIERTAARYLKVVTHPLAAAITADKRFADIFVTELQPLLVSAAQAVRGRTSATTQTLNAALHHQILPVPLLAYDFSGILTHTAGASTYTVINGLSLDHRLNEILAVSSRVARQDNGVEGTAEGQHTGSFQYSASLIAKPVPALIDTITYSGQYGTTVHGTVNLNAVTWLNRSALYKGVDLLVSAGYAYNILETGALSRGPTVITTLSLVPNPKLTLASTYYYSYFLQTGGGAPDFVTESERVDGSVSFTPFPALYLAGTISRLIKGPRPTTLATFGGTFSPFPDGAFLLRATYTETLDTASNSLSRIATAAVRWNLNSRVALDLAYSLLRSSSDVGSSEIRQFTAGLIIQL